MKIKLDLKNKRMVFLLCVIFFELLYWVMCIIFRGVYLQTYFSPAVNDTYMDYYNMLYLTNYKDPYIRDANYPPMVFAILKTLHRIVSPKFRAGASEALRNVEHAILGMILCMIGSFFLIALSVKMMIKDEKIMMFTALACFFSGPFLFSIERFNFIIISFACLMIYMALWDSEKKYQRYIAYVFLAISAATKLYPALFGLLVAEKKRWKETIHLVIIGLVMYIAPAFVFRGWDSLIDSIRGIFAASDFYANRGMGYNFSFKNLIKIFGAIGGKRIARPAGGVILIAIVLTIALYITSRDLWKKALAICLMCIWIPEFSYTYTLILMIAPFILFLNDKTQYSVYDHIYCVCWFFIFVPLYLPLTTLDFEGAGLYLSWPTLITNLIMVFMYMVVLVENIADLKKRKKELTN